MVVLDSCSDGSAEVAEQWRAESSTASFEVDIIELGASCVGTARRVGAEALLRRWADVPIHSLWIATTDADSEVPVNWISAQLQMFRQGAEVWAGSVTVGDWDERLEGTAASWTVQYTHERFPVHGANLGCSAALYREVGGFDEVSTGEDRALVMRALALGAAIRHGRGLHVVTSSRRAARAPLGFAHALTVIEDLVSNRSDRQPTVTLP